MMVDIAGLLEFSRGSDRDDVRYFVGRDDEQATFDAALAETVRRDIGDLGGALLLYQGAPGAGKTALLGHLRATRSDRALFVTLPEGQLSSTEKMLAGVRAVAERDVARGYAAAAAHDILALLRAPETGRKVASHASTATLAKTPVVLLIDEAQALGEAHGECLRDIHRGTCGVKMLAVLAGLGHTERTVRSIRGMSRLAGNFVFQMTPLSCAESTRSVRAMLDEFDVTGAERHLARLATKVADDSYGWPQHLRAAMQVAAAELARADGDASAVDLERVATAARERRADYYLKRVEGSLLEDEEPALLVQTVHDARFSKPVGLVDLHRVYRRAAERHGIGEADRPTPERYVDAMLERGIIQRQRGGFSVPIPSMGDWILGEYARTMRIEPVAGKD